VLEAEPLCPAGVAPSPSPGPITHCAWEQPGNATPSADPGVTDYLLSAPATRFPDHTLRRAAPASPEGPLNVAFEAVEVGLSRQPLSTARGCALDVWLSVAAEAG
jgi:hypothetical protein